jgi:hypothetical protein
MLSPSVRGVAEGHPASTGHAGGCQPSQSAPFVA